MSLRVEVFEVDSARAVNTTEVASGTPLEQATAAVTAMAIAARPNRFMCARRFDACEIPNNCQGMRKVRSY